MNRRDFLKACAMLPAATVASRYIHTGASVAVIPTTRQQTIYYVAPGGRGDKSGTSPKNAFSELSDVASQLKLGDTLYFMPGTYKLTSAW